jgi:hypothetical protein
MALSQVESMASWVGTEYECAAVPAKNEGLHRGERTESAESAKGGLLLDGFLVVGRPVCDHISLLGRQVLREHRRGEGWKR